MTINFRWWENRLVHQFPSSRIFDGLGVRLNESEKGSTITCAGESETTSCVVRKIVCRSSGRLSIGPICLTPPYCYIKPTVFASTFLCLPLRVSLFFWSTGCCGTTLYVVVTPLEVKKAIINRQVRCHLGTIYLKWKIVTAWPPSCTLNLEVRFIQRLNKSATKTLDDRTFFHLSSQHFFGHA